jgi:hypothetical protein
MRVAIVSDTHVPNRARAIPAWVREELKRAEYVLHAGDWDAVDTVETIRELAGGADRLTGVRGNVDPPAVDLPEVATVELGGVTFVVTHGSGPHHGYRERVARRVRAHGGTGAVGVAGHIHEYVDETVDGVRLLNPGSATGASPASEPTMMVAEVADGTLSVDRRDAY